MAIQVNYNIDRYGLESGNAYAKITQFIGDKVQLRFMVCIWASAEARFEEKEPIATCDYVLQYDNQTLTDLYNYLKTLPEFEGATDILEN